MPIAPSRGTALAGNHWIDCSRNLSLTRPDDEGLNVRLDSEPRVVECHAQNTLLNLQLPLRVRKSCRCVWRAPVSCCEATPRYHSRVCQACRVPCGSAEHRLLSVVGEGNPIAHEAMLESPCPRNEGGVPWEEQSTERGQTEIWRRGSAVVRCWCGIDGTHGRACLWEVHGCSAHCSPRRPHMAPALTTLLGRGLQWRLPVSAAEHSLPKVVHLTVSNEDRNTSERECRPSPCVCPPSV